MRMRSLVLWIRTWALLLVLGIAVLGSAPAGASPIVLLGDSWGVGIGPSVRSTLDAEGFSSLAIHNASVGGSRAVQWNANQFGTMSSILAGDADAKLIHLIVGGNDLLAGLSNPTVAITNAISNTLGVLNKIVAASSVPVLFSGYEWLAAPPAPFPPSLANALLDSFVNGVAAGVAGDPLLASRVTVMNTHGLMQVHFGVPQNGIPAFDPSLPNASLPGPSTAFFDQIHLNRAGYDVLAQHLYDEFYGPVLVPEPTTALLVLVGLAPLAARARNGARAGR